MNAEMSHQQCDDHLHLHLPSISDLGGSGGVFLAPHASYVMSNAPRGLGLSHVAAELGAGSLAGIACIISGFPFDTVKTRLQTSPPGTYRGMAHCGVEVVRKHGVRGVRGRCSNVPHITMPGTQSPC